MGTKTYTGTYRGKPFNITGPDDATDAQLKAALARRYVEPEAPKPVGLEATMGEQANQDLATALQTGLATSATKTVRGIGTTVLPKAAEAYLESKGILPTSRDVQLLQAGTAASPAAQVANVASDVATDILPASKIMKGAQGAHALEAGSRGLVLGGSLAGMRAEGDQVVPEALKGAVGGAVGAMAPSAAGTLLSKTVKPSDKAVELMRRGIVPTLGQGVDQSRVTGRVLTGLENQLETMPITGAMTRAARTKPTEQLFDEASHLGVVPGGAAPVGSRIERVDQLLREGGEAQGNALRGTTMRVTPVHQARMETEIDNMAAKYGLSPIEANGIKQELDRRIWSGTSNDTFPAQAMENVKEDLFAGLRPPLNSNKVQAAVNDLAGQVKDWTNKSAQAAGHDLPAIRQAQVNANVLRRAGGSETGTSGPRLIRGVEANDRAMGVSDTASREMRDLADAASIIPDVRPAWGSRNVQQLSAGLAKEGGLGLTGGLGHTAAMGYNAVNANPWVRQLLMGDPQTRQAFINALRPSSTAVGVASEEP